MSDKVKLPKNVTEAIEKCREGYSEKDVIAIAIADYKSGSYREMQVFANEYFEVFLKAIVNGYEIEESPEDQVRECFKNPPLFNNGIGELSTSYRNGIRDTLDTLNIKIEGVN